MPRKTARVRSIAARARPASMRPRPDAAENNGAGNRPTSTYLCFNEAAARCRGKLAADGAEDAGQFPLQ